MPKKLPALRDAASTCAAASWRCQLAPPPQRTRKQSQRIKVAKAVLAPLQTDSIACMPTELTTAACTDSSNWACWLSQPQPQGLQETLPWRLAGMVPCTRTMGVHANTGPPALCSEQAPRETGLRTTLCVCSMHTFEHPSPSYHHAWVRP